MINPLTIRNPGFLPKVTGDYHASYAAVKAAIEGALGSSLTTTQNNAGDRLVRELNGQLNSANGYATMDLWSTKLAGKALYGFLGGTAAAHKFNWINPVDTNAGFRLIFTGGWTHSSTGALPSSGYANTFLAPSSVLSLNSCHLSYYSRTNNTTTSNYADIGAGTEVPYYYLALYTGYTSGSNRGYFICYNGNSGNDNPRGTTSNNPNSQAFYIGSRTSSTSADIYRNGTLIGSNTNSAATSQPSQNVYIGAENFNGAASGYGNRECAFASAGDGLTSSEALAYSNAVSSYQTSLSRNV